MDSIKNLASKLRALNEKVTILDEQSLISNSSNGVRFFRIKGDKLYKSKFYKSITPIPEFGIAKVESFEETENNKGLIDYTGEEKVAPIYKSIGTADRFIIAKQSFPVFIMDAQYNILIPTLYKSCRSIWKCKDGTCIFSMTSKNKNGDSIYSIDTNNVVNNLLTDKELLTLVVTDDGYIIACGETTEKDKTNTYVIYNIFTKKFWSDLARQVSYFDIESITRGPSMVKIALKNGSITKFKIAESIIM